MIHFAIGTKAQFIKMAPIMHLLELAREPYHLLDLSQHANITGRILEDFRLRPVVTQLAPGHRSIETYAQAVVWLARGFGQALRHASGLRRRWFVDTAGIVLVHGDTLSTLMGLYLARNAGLRTGLVEAGLTSRRLFDPFPEEFVRRHVERRVDYLFAPSNIAALRLRRKYPADRVIDTQYNTGRDAMQLVLRGNTDPARTSEYPAEEYGVVTLHRLETLGNRHRLRRAVRHILALVAMLGRARFYVHPPTRNALIRCGLHNELAQTQSIQLHDLAPYPEFVRALTTAKYVLTDGGSIQEEAAYLNKPCVILRHRTERLEGLNQNAILSTWDPAQDAELIEQISAAPPAEPPSGNLDASRAVLSALSDYHSGHNVIR